MLQDVPPRPTELPSVMEVQRAVARVFEDTELRERAFRRVGIDDGGFVTRVIDWLESCLDWFEDLRSATPGLYWLVVIVLVLALALLVWHLAWMFRVAFRSSSPEVHGGEPAAARRRRFGELHGTARQLAAGGKMRDAVRTLLLALLALLEERRALEVASGRTTREILGRLAARIGNDTAISGFRAAVEAVTYGRSSVDPQGFERLDRAVVDLAAAITARPPA
jgi:hypothetical protein